MSAIVTQSLWLSPRLLEFQYNNKRRDKIHIEYVKSVAVITMTRLEFGFFFCVCVCRDGWMCVLSPKPRNNNNNVRKTEKMSLSHLPSEFLRITIMLHYSGISIYIRGRSSWKTGLSGLEIVGEWGSSMIYIIQIPASHMLHCDEIFFHIMYTCILYFTIFLNLLQFPSFQPKFSY